MATIRSPNGDDIAKCVLEAFQRLPSKRKPLRRDDGKREWVPLSGIVLVKDGQPLVCASLGTGMKCLPRSKIPQANGTVLHDWHAETLAIRAFNRFLIYECAAVANPHFSSRYVQRRETVGVNDSSPHPFVIQDDVFIYMYCSEAPCGDASMELTMQAQDDPTPWEVPQSNHELSETGDILRGRGFFSELGVVRRKPARPDAPETLSKSCTDKLSLYQCTSILNSVTSLLLAPDRAYIKTLVLPQSQHVAVATTRAFAATGRMSPLSSGIAHSWPNGFAFNPLDIKTTSSEFHWSRRSSECNGKAMVPSNISSVYTPYFQETLVGGVLQGRKPSDPGGACAICRKSMWRAVVDLAARFDLLAVQECCRKETYEELKGSEMLQDRRKVKVHVLKAALKGWVSNTGDEIFGLDCIQSTQSSVTP